MLTKFEEMGRNGCYPSFSDLMFGRPSIIVGKWSILVGKQKHNVHKPD